MNVAGRRERGGAAGLRHGGAGPAPRHALNDAPCPPLTSHGASIMWHDGAPGAGPAPQAPARAGAPPTCLLLIDGLRAPAAILSQAQRVLTLKLARRAARSTGGSQKCRIAGKAQSVLMMTNPVIIIHPHLCAGAVDAQEDVLRLVEQAAHRAQLARQEAPPLNEGPHVGACCMMRRARCHRPATTPQWHTPGRAVLTEIPLCFRGPHRRSVSWRGRRLAW
jgi:hypothetical protein